MIVLLDRLGSVTGGTGADATWSGARLARETRRRASRLHTRGIGPGDRVMITHGGTPAFFADLFATWQVGACAACLNPGLMPSELSNVATFLAPKLILAAASSAEAISGADVISLAGDEVAGEPASGRLDDPALILFTSGTTGTPKGVVHSFRSLAARIALNQTVIPAAERARVLCPLPTHFGHGLIGNALTALTAGGDVTLFPGSDLRSAAQLGATIDRLGITFMSSVPSFWRLAMKASKPPQRGTLRRVHVGSAPLSAGLWREIAAWCGTRNVVNMYGITETANWIAGASAADHEPEDGLVGRMWGGDAAVIGDDGELRAEGRGEIVVQPPSLMVEYLQRPDLTAEALTGGWLRTGDTGRIDRDGTIRLTGRIKHEINQAGIKVSPEDIDILLDQHASVRDVCAFGMPDALAGEIVAVAVCPSNAAGFDIAGLKSWVAEHLAREKRPQRWFIVESVPRSDRGKLDRAAVAQLCSNLTPV